MGSKFKPSKKYDVDFVRLKSESDAYFINNNTNNNTNNHNYNLLQPKNQMSHNVPALSQEYRNILSDKKLLAQTPEYIKNFDPRSQNVSVIVNSKSKEFLTPIVFKSKK